VRLVRDTLIPLRHAQDADDLCQPLCTGCWGDAEVVLEALEKAGYAVIPADCEVKAEATWVRYDGNTMARGLDIWEIKAPADTKKVYVVEVDRG
jgi:hypothetical protein